MRRLLLTITLLALALPLTGQTINPTEVMFTPSASHNQTLPTGEAYVTKYTLYFYTTGSTSSVRNVSLGKPDPGPDGKIHVKVLSTLVLLTKNTTHYAKVYASGAVGSTASAASNEFQMVGAAPATNVVIQ